MRIHTIKNKRELREALNELFEGISKDCRNCKYIDCRGYVWLHPCETKEICTKTDTITINDNIVFVDSFIRENGQIDPGKLQPACRLRDACGKCLIQDIKPVVCMLYPLNLRNVDGEIWLVLNEDCLFVDNLKKKKRLEKFKEDIRQLWDRLDRRFLRDLVDTFNKYESISLYPPDYHKDTIKMIRTA
jgi:Fe-S-cluster containining protein